jgi:HPt (histidine-containing phosphotransfer) domain-containing protein
MSSTIQLLLYCLLAFGVGASAGISDLLSRYSWTFRSIVVTSSGLAYLLINGAVAMAAYFAVVEFDLDFGLRGRPEVWRVVLVALFAMAALRSSVAKVRIGNQEVAAGLVAFFEPFTRRTIRSLDQQITDQGWSKIAPLITGMVYSASKQYLLVLTETTLRTLTEAEKTALRSAADKIDVQAVDDPTKMQLFAMLLVDTVGLALCTTFAKNAKIALVAENAKAAQQAEENLRRLRTAKDLLQS